MPDWEVRHEITQYKGGKMNGSFIRCTVAILSAASLLAMQEPSRDGQTTDSFLRNNMNEPDLNGVKADNVLLQVRLFSSFFDKNFNSFKDFQQDNNNNKFFTDEEENIVQVSDHEFELLCYLVAAEAENQPFEGKCAVVGVVLNRSEFGKPFTSGIEGAIFQPGAFSCISDGRFFEAYEYVSEEDEMAVITELKERKYDQYLYFTAGHYGKYGTPSQQIGDHYFCTN